MAWAGTVFETLNTLTAEFINPTETTSVVEYYVII